METIEEQRQPICLFCKNYIKGWKCKAFAEIPIEILRGENDHTKILPNQGNDIVYEPKDNEG